MAPITFSFSVQLLSDGRVDVHSWQATYSATGRQIPSHLVTQHDLEDSDLSYLVGEFADAVILHRRLLLAKMNADLPI